MSTRSHPLALACLGLLTACPPPEPPPVSGGELRAGRWTVVLRDARVEGRCDGLSARDLEGEELSAVIEVEGRRAWMELEGLELSGRYADRWLELAGTADAEVVLTEEAESGTVVDDGDAVVDDGDEDLAEPPPCDAPDGDEEWGGRPGDGREPADIVVHLGAEVPDPLTFDGLLELDVAVGGDRCQVQARALGHHVDAGVVQPGDDEVFSEDEPLRGDDDPDDPTDGDGGSRDPDVDTGMP